MVERTYEVGSSKITIRFRDITTSKSEILVSSDDFDLSMGGGVSAAILRAGGASIHLDARKFSPAQVGDIVVTTAGNLPAKYILHAVTIGYCHELPGDAIVRQTTRRAMQLLPRLGCKTIAFPAIGAGVARIPFETVAVEMAGAIIESLIDVDHKYHVELYLLDRYGIAKEDDWFTFFEVFAARRLGLSTTKDRGLEPRSTNSTDRFEPAETERQREVYLMLRHLDTRRSELESRLIATLSNVSSTGNANVSVLRHQLDDIRELRKNYASELTIASKATSAGIAQSVFVSSTSGDLKPH